jgi:plastocyanin
MDRRRFLASATGALAIGVAGCLGFEEGQAAGDHDVGMTQVDFRPESLTVDVGTTVEFLNTSSHGHTVTAVDIPDGASYFATGGFDSYEAAMNGWESNNSGVLSQGDSFTHTFEVPGRYDYVCIPHLASDMRGQITVEE